MEKQIAKTLLDAKAVFLRPREPFTWASGIKSPIYCDNRLILSYPEKRSFVKDALTQLIKTKFPEVEGIMGTATAGIPMAALIANDMELPMGYVRSSNKAHGKENKIEGIVNKGQKFVIIEDLISTGGSVKGAVEAIREAGGEVLGVCAIFTYLLNDSIALFKELNTSLETISNYDALVEVALEENYIEASDLKKLQAWKVNPRDESWINQ